MTLSTSNLLLSAVIRRSPRSLALLVMNAVLLQFTHAQNIDDDSSDDSYDGSHCKTFEECCATYGTNSKRCLRGPCSREFIMYQFFSLSMPTKDVEFWDVMTVIYSMMPYLIVITMVVEMLFHKRSIMRIQAIIIPIVFTVLNTNILVKVLGDCSECARPYGSCLATNGMPSGHATNAIGLWTWVQLETFVGAGKPWTIEKKALICFVSSLLFVPVPYSRVYLGDHTPLQVTIGSIDGFVWAIIYFFILRTAIAQKFFLWLCGFCKRRLHFTVENDFYPPQEEAPLALEVALIERDNELEKGNVELQRVSATSSISGSTSKEL